MPRNCTHVLDICARRLSETLCRSRHGKSRGPARPARSAACYEKGYGADDGARHRDGVRGEPGGDRLPLRHARRRCSTRRCAGRWRPGATTSRRRRRAGGRGRTGTPARAVRGGVVGGAGLVRGQPGAVERAVRAAGPDRPRPGPEGDVRRGQPGGAARAGRPLRRRGRRATTSPGGSRWGRSTRRCWPVRRRSGSPTPDSPPPAADMVAALRAHRHHPRDLTARRRHGACHGCGSCGWPAWSDGRANSGIDARPTVTGSGSRAAKGGRGRAAGEAGAGWAGGKLSGVDARGRRGTHDAGEPLGDVLRGLGGGRLDHHPHQRLGAGRAQQHPAGRRPARPRPPRPRRAPPGPARRRVRSPTGTLISTCGSLVTTDGQLGQRLAGRGHPGHQVQPGRARRRRWSRTPA